MASLLIATGIIVVAVYAPGFLFFRALGFSKLVAAICAPLYSVAVIAGLPILYYPLGIPCDAITVLGPTFLIALVLWAVATRETILCCHPEPKAKDLREAADQEDVTGSPLRGDSSLALRMTTRMRFPRFLKSGLIRLDVMRSKRVRIFRWNVPFEYIALLAYMACGLVVTLVIFGAEIDSVDLFMPYNDNKTHLNLLRAFLDSGQWSSLHENRFISSDQNASSMLFPAYKFYPCAMHDLILLVCCITNADIVIAYHAVILMFLLITLPTSLFLLMKVLFPGERHVIMSGAVISVSFSAFPWPALLLMGPLTPFFICVVCSVPVIALGLLYIEQRLVRRKLASFVASGIISVITLALTQTSALFGVYVFLGAYSCHLLGQRVEHLSRVADMPIALRKLLKVASALVLAGVLLGMLMLASQLPFLQSVVNYSSTKYHELPDTMFRLLTFGFQAGEPQYLMSAIAAIGVIESFRKRKAWLLAPSLYFALAYIGLSTEAEPLHSLNWLSGFWYHTWHRMGMLCALFLIPSTSMGLSLIIRLVMAPIALVRKQPLGDTAKGAVISILLLAMFAAIIFTGFSAFEKLQKQAYSAMNKGANRAYSLQESQFVDKVVQTVPEGALVINDPNDGSVFSYGVNKLNTYYRKFASSGLTEDALLIKKSLSNYAHDSEVREAVERTGAEYVMLLDQGVTFDEGKWVTGTTESILKGYSGINGITDDTPGFQVVLAEGDMKLYRILKD